MRKDEFRIKTVVNVFFNFSYLENREQPTIPELIDQIIGKVLWDQSFQLNPYSLRRNIPYSKIAKGKKIAEGLFSFIKNNDKLIVSFDGDKYPGVYGVYENQKYSCAMFLNWYHITVLNLKNKRSTFGFQGGPNDLKKDIKIMTVSTV